MKSLKSWQRVRIQEMTNCATSLRRLRCAVAIPPTTNMHSKWKDWVRQDAYDISNQNDTHPGKIIFFLIFGKADGYWCLMLYDNPVQSQTTLDEFWLILLVNNYIFQLTRLKKKRVINVTVEQIKTQLICFNGPNFRPNIELWISSLANEKKTCRKPAASLF